IANADALATTLMENGLRVVSGGTENHLMVVDFGQDGPSGKVVEAALAKANITVNKNTVPRETRSAFVTSGVRIGSPAVTSRGMGVPDMQRIGAGIAEVVHNRKDKTILQRVQRDVLDLCGAFPAPV
ncbi:MAG: serine hydroxymethyltransferase, partial [Chloroflexota bacterium]|nr:serine hydroxymethyltransferase [Chloroflexota bacterium]